MNRYEIMLFFGFLALYLPAFGLYHLMVFKVNRQLPSDRRIPHSLTFSKGGWNKLRREFKHYYPESLLYRLTVTCAITCFIIAVLFAGFRILEYAIGR